MKQILQNKWWAIAIVLLIAANLATLTFFWVDKLSLRKQIPESRRDFRHPRPPQLLLEELDFSNEQQNKYDSLFNKHISNVGILKDSIRQAKEAFFSLLSDSQISMDELQKRTAEAASLQGRLDMLTFEHFRKVKAICTADQQHKFDKIIVNIVERMAPPPPRRGGPDGNRPPPPPGEGSNGPDSNDPPPPPGH